MFRMLVQLILLLAISASANAYEWTSRTGDSLGEANIVDVGDDFVMLKMVANRKTVKISFSKLSLADIEYAKQKKQELEGGPPVDIQPGANVGGWNVKSDPPAFKWNKPPRRNLSIPTNGTGLIVPSVPSPFIALNSKTRNAGWEIFDLRTGRATGKFGGGRRFFGRGTIALSADGEWAVTAGERGKLDVWSCKTGSVSHQIDLADSSASPRSFDFLDGKRLIVPKTNDKLLAIYDASSGKLLSRIKLGEEAGFSINYSISAGGSYVAITDKNVVSFINLKTGQTDGELQVANESYSRADGLGWSADGSEFGVVAGSSKKTLTCWSLRSGKQLVQHKLSDSTRLSFSGIGNVVPAMQWLPGQRGWLLMGQHFVDGKAGGPVWSLPNKSGLRQSGARVVGGESLLVFEGSSGSGALRITPIPWQNIDQGSQLVEKGAQAKDVGLPEVKVADWRGVTVRMASSRPAAKYEPVLPGAIPVVRTKKLQFDAADFRPQSLFVTPEGGGRAYIYSEPRKRNSSDFANRWLGWNCEQFEVKTGKQLSSFTVPISAKFVGATINGDNGLFIGPEEQRLDLYDLTNSKHIVGFRPIKDAKFGRIREAFQLDDGKLLTLTSDGKLVGWDQTKCKAQYMMEIQASKCVLNPSRSHAAVFGSGGVIYILDTKSGKANRKLRTSDDIGFISSAAFRADGRLFAATRMENEKTHLMVWDVKGSKLICDLSIPQTVSGMDWCGKAHVLLRTHSPSRQPGKAVDVVDVAKKRIVWTYRLPPSGIFASGIGDRLWALVPTNRRTTGMWQIVAEKVPHKSAARTIAKSKPPRPLFAADRSIKLEVLTGALPDELPERRKKEEAFEKEVRSYFEGALERAGLKVVGSAPLTFNVSIRNLTQQ